MTRQQVVPTILTAASILIGIEAARSQCSDWQAGISGVNSDVYVMEVFDPGGGPRLYVGGQFTGSMSRIGCWNGTSWSSLGIGLEAGVSGTAAYAMAVHDDGGGAKLYVGGAFGMAGGSPAKNIAAWDGASWSAVGGGMDDGIVQGLCVWDDGSGPVLVASGRFTSVEGGTPANHLAYWNGATWAEFAGGADSFVESLLVSAHSGSPLLYAGGRYATIGGTSASRIASWDGSSWSPLGAGVNQFVADMTVYDDGWTGPELIVAGAFTQAGGLDLPWIARWDGSEWGSLGHGPTNIVDAVTVFDSGAGCGPMLVAGGMFGQFGGEPTAWVAQWNGTDWSPLDTGMNLMVWEVQQYDTGATPALYAGGAFTSAGGTSVARFAKWTDSCPCVPSVFCTAGLTTNGCQASVSATGTPSASAPSGFDVTVADVEGQKAGIVFFGTAGWQETPWGGGSSSMCVAKPRRRTAVQLSGGTPGGCDGAMTLDFNAWMAAHSTEAPPPGQRVWLQAWFRDPPSPATTNLSDGLSFVVQP